MDGLTTTDIVQAVRESAMLADVSISSWSARRSDKQASTKLTSDAGASSNAAEVKVKLMVGAEDNYKNIVGAFTAVRTLHISLTLPWIVDPHAERQRGPRLLPNALFHRYLETLSKQKREAQALLDGWDVDADIARAKLHLGTLTRDDYPSAEQIKKLFHVSFNFEPLPEGTKFRGLHEQVINKLARSLDERYQRMAEDAQRAMWQEARARVTHIVEQLGDTDKRLFDSTITRTRDLLTLLPGWNVTNNPAVDEIVQDIKTLLDGVDAKSLRKDGGMRLDVADKARRLVTKMDSLGV